MAESATAVGLAAYVGVCALAWGAWKLTNVWSWGVPVELLGIPAGLAGLAINPAAEWYRRVSDPVKVDRERSR